MQRTVPIPCGNPECSEVTLNKRFCSIHCTGVTLCKARRIHAEAQDVRCEGCDKTFRQSKATQRFCTQSCSARHNNALRGNARQKCKGCSKRLQYDNTTGFCRGPCREQEQIRLWLDGSLDGGAAGGSVRSFVPRWMIDSFGECCCICGWNEVHPITGRVVVEIDHVDGDSTNCASTNLRFLCRNHHALTSTYKALNRGRGRKRAV